MNDGMRSSYYFHQRKQIIPQDAQLFHLERFLDGFLYVLRTGCQWKMFPKEYGSGFTCHRRFQQWTLTKVFQRLWNRLLQVYDDVKGIGWKWQSLDSVSIKAPLGGT